MMLGNNHLHTTIIMLSIEVKCKHPRTMFLYRHPGDKWIRTFKFDTFVRRANDYEEKKEVIVPCGQCISCRVNKAREWQVRGLLEQTQWDESSFITLTYDDDHLPENKSLVKKHLVDFNKRLRDFVFRKYGKHITILGCGEYGESTDRPHYHEIIYGFDFPDRYPFGRKHGNVYYRSERLEKLWTDGNSVIGDCTRESIGYVCQYVLKKVTGKQAKEVYTKRGRIPPFAVYPCRPALGLCWFEKYFTDMFPKDSVHVDGRIVRPPRYFMRKLEQYDPDLFEKVKSLRLDAVSEDLPEVVLDFGNGSVPIHLAHCDLAEENARSIEWMEEVYEKFAKRKEL